MPVQFVPYLIGLVQGIFVTATSLERQFGYSHDGITRSLTKRFPWEQWIMLVIHKLFGALSGGYLIIDDTVIAKPYAKKMDGASFVHSSLLDRTIFGYNIVFLCWSNGTLTIPLLWRWYKPNSKTKIDLAMILLREAKQRWKLTPRYVLFDTYYSAERIINRIVSYKWQVVGQLKCNRIINAAPIKEDLTHQGDAAIGDITDQVKGRIVRYDKKFFFTTDLSLSLNEMTALYQKRWPIEEVFRFLKSELRLEACQARTKQAQKTHLASCVLAYLIFQKEQQMKKKETLYSIRRLWQMDRRLGRNQINHYVKVLTA
ncbi:MAG: transposase [Patescibacteria group bacterium]